MNETMYQRKNVPAIVVSIVFGIIFALEFLWCAFGSCIELIRYIIDFGFNFYTFYDVFIFFTYCLGLLLNILGGIIAAVIVFYLFIFAMQLKDYNCKNLFLVGSTLDLSWILINAVRITLKLFVYIVRLIMGRIYIEYILKDGILYNIPCILFGILFLIALYFVVKSINQDLSTTLDIDTSDIVNEVKYAFFDFRNNIMPAMGKVKDAADNAIEEAKRQKEIRAQKAAEEARKRAEQQEQMRAAAEERRRAAMTNGSYTGRAKPGYPDPPVFKGIMLQTDRDAIVAAVLSYITCGIYECFFRDAMVRDVNIICEGDNDNTIGGLTYALLCLVTCGIYGFFWNYNLAERLRRNAPRYGLDSYVGGSDITMWLVLGFFTGGICYFVARYMIVKEVNRLCRAYNEG